MNKKQSELYEDLKESFDMETWWGLNYSQYLTIPRSVIQEMPREWQDKFAGLLFELDYTFDWRPENVTYWCVLRNRETGRYESDILCNYRHDPEVKRIIESMRR